MHPNDKTLVQKIKGFKAQSNALVEQNLALVRDGSLTVEEAAQCLAGGKMKLAEEFGRPALPHDVEYRDALLSLDQKLPGYDGLVLGRHI